MRLRFKKLHRNAKAPYLGTPFSAGFDLTAVAIERDAINDVDIYHTGLALEIPKGYFGLLVLRSSSFRTGHRLSMGAAILDSDYRGEVIVPLDRRGGEHPLYEIGDRLAQVVIVPCSWACLERFTWEEAEELSSTQRGTGGYGSTGRQ